MNPTTNTEAGAVADVAAKLTEFNINEHVWIKLTDAGRKHHRERDRARYPMLDYSAPVESEDGWSRWQLWHLMQVFGEAIYMGGTAPFETTIRLAVRQHLEQGATAGVVGGKERG